MCELIRQGIYRLREYNDLTKGTENPQIVEIQNNNNGAINAFLAVLDYCERRKTSLEISAKGTI